MAASKIFNTKDLILNVNTKSYDPEKLPFSEWQGFLDVLCENREYQKQAIKTAILYLASGRYKSIEDLVTENYKQNDQLKLRYNTEKDYLNKLQIKNKLIANIDLATGTGKSFVMYGIAQLALGLGIVDKVLVLGPPSLTIEKGLTDKFTVLASNPTLRNSIPDKAKYSTPAIINADKTIVDGCICIENINAVYAKTGSSILDSLSGKGSRCLVLCDEVHHTYNIVEGKTEDAQSIKKWKEFLIDPIFSFNYILGFTGTAYINNEYFNDVIYRYSLRNAIENKFVKNVNYVVENTDNGEHEKFQKILQNHQRNKKLYSKIKPITILVTKDIKEAKQLKTRLVEFLVEKKQGSEETLNEEKVLLVTSDKDHKAAILKLPYVDSKDQPVEWIISVAMLTEGWDVKNVFQIVPMEEKAFNSKLLIAQVLGRGLRIPEFYPNAEVTIFNHDKWSGSIKNLVEEILEMETKVKNSVLLSGERSKYHFTLHNINYKKEYSEIETQDTKVFNYKDYIEFVTETFEHKTETKYIKINDREYPVVYDIEKEKFPIEEIINKVFDEFQIRKLEGVILKLNETEYTNENLPTKEVIEKVIRKSMEKVGMTGNYLGKSNRQAVFSTFNTLLRKKPRSISLTKTPDILTSIETKKREHENVSVLGLRSDTTIFYTVDFETEIAINDTLNAFREIKSDLTLPRQSFNDPINPFLFKTPIDLVFATRDPERKFIQALTNEENSKNITAWLKSKNQNFYTIDYTISTKAGRHSTQHQFNPDFFILVQKDNKDYIAVVETKSDGDDAEENKAKYKYASEHFSDLNLVLLEKGINQQYFFHFLSPNNYSEFFDCLKDGRLFEGKFRSQLDKSLSIVE
jgi:type III restriction enzyme